MYRFLLRPRWIGFHLLVIGAVVLMVNLAFWQLRRLDQRREFNATVTERIEQDPVPIDALVADELAGADADPHAVEWRLVTASGTYLPDQIVLFNRSQSGVAGDDVLTPLVLDDGRIVIVNRGFVPLGLDVPPAPSGDVEVLGRVRPSEERRRGQLTDAEDGPVTEVRRVEIDRIAPQLPGEVLPVYLDLVDAAPAPDTGDPVPVPAPELNEGPHLSYAVQWFIFATCAVVGWVLAVRRSILTRKAPAPATIGPRAGTGVPDRGLTDAAGPSDGAARPPSGGDATTTAPTGTTGSSPH